MINIIIIDSVINIGNSIKEIVDLFPNDKKIYIVSLVMQEKSKVKSNISRLSSNFYIGKGNRLFRVKA